ncbi:MAG: hypothetical protein IJD04_03560, partial [Desulfovibrionaceae bacterium]|nr:hypothetical protein [Desulfovibrionaceae bacterium]
VQIIQSRSEQTIITGNLDASLDVLGELRSSDDIPAALNGQCAFNIGKGYFVRSETGGPAGHMDKPLHSNFDFVKGSAKIQSGVLLTDDLLLDGPSTHMAGHGQVNLVKNELDIVMDLSMGGVAFPVTVTGKLSAPQISLRGGKFVTRNITNLGGGLINLIGGIITLPVKLIDGLNAD